jgi:hypothetical protein
MESIQHKNIMENSSWMEKYMYCFRQLLFSVNITFFHAVFPGINLKIKFLNTTGKELNWLQNMYTITSEKRKRKVRTTGNWNCVLLSKCSKGQPFSVGSGGTILIINVLYSIFLCLEASNYLSDTETYTHAHEKLFWSIEFCYQQVVLYRNWVCKFVTCMCTWGQELLH